MEQDVCRDRLRNGTYTNNWVVRWEVKRSGSEPTAFPSCMERVERHVTCKKKKARKNWNYKKEREPACHGNFLRYRNTATAARIYVLR